MLTVDLACWRGGKSIGVEILGGKSNGRILPLKYRLEILEEDVSVERGGIHQVVEQGGGGGSFKQPLGCGILGPKFRIAP